eukprot:TRINITY_DN180_c1_g1_i2.p1 TRINITY_DN180_c1_g1~~TRINITY_DN180_c1_g1_i2.p1  ORF type:complete len:475 (+),score=119.70 TRINITY_DN180_c1_g1_i2:235-1659(+)
MFCLFLTLLLSVASTSIVSATPETASGTPSAANQAGGGRRVGNFELLQTIGKGAFGKVKLAVDTTTGQKRAIKIFDKKRLRQGRGLRTPGKRLPDPLQDLDVEIAVMKKLDHPNVVKLYEVLDDPASDKLFMVLEWAEKGEVLADWTPPGPNFMSESDAWRLFRELISGLSYLHVQNIIHRDIKPANLLLSADDRLKICDFGLSQVLENSQEVLTNMKGSPCFFAPEIVTCRGFAGKPLDVWAAGITLFYFMYGHPPFQATNLFELVEAIKNTSLSFPWELPPLLENLLRAMLQKDPDARPKISDVREHPWVTKNGQFPLDEPLAVSVTEHEIRTAIKPLINIVNVVTMGNKVAKRSRWKRAQTSAGAIGSESAVQTHPWSRSSSSVPGPAAAAAEQFVDRLRSATGSTNVPSRQNDPGPMPVLGWAKQSIGRAPTVVAENDSVPMDEGAARPLVAQGAIVLPGIYAVSDTAAR